MTYFYDDYVIELSRKFSARLEDIKADYNFDLGDEFEIAICLTLRTFLPTKYGICRGFVVDREGNKEGDDIIIYDQLNFPTIRTNTKDDYSRKENIPIEAVYAYIEAKHTLNKESFEKSVLQIGKVKTLCQTRGKTDLYQTDPCVGKYVDRGNVLEHQPKYRNPILTIILSRYSSNIDNKKAENEEEIKEFLKTYHNIFPSDCSAPELIISGKDNILAIGYVNDKKEPIGTLFYPDNGFKVGYESLIKKDLAFGIFLCHLMASLNWIRLGNMPWVDMLNQARKNNNCG
ncbi:DUF6602 domain-containing protein [Flavobacterium sp. ZB4R12]|uniref:DUF6602 domain-containing protein n=1 Tax=Flavobacterium sp. ZB4R12 TaxID=3398732 RepID=UPI003AADBD3E